MPRLRVGEIELAYEIDGEGEPLLLLMGLGGDRQGWDLVRADLARRHRLVLLDNRDAGESDEAGGPYGLPDMAADALALMDHLGIERFHVAGASMGGAIAQHLALQAPTRIASLVLACTWGRTDGFLAAILGAWRTQVERLDPEAFLAGVMPWAFTYRAFLEPPPALVAFQEARRARGALLRSVAAYQRQVDACLGHDLLGVLPLLRTPTLVLVGEDDILTPPRYARALAASLAAAEVVVVPATGHACFLETPKAVADRMLQFLTARGSVREPALR
jgi:pimeloyl-ACP methyl ester carboxylesterase